MYEKEGFRKYVIDISIEQINKGEGLSKHNYILVVNYNDMFRPKQRPSSGYNL